MNIDFDQIRELLAIVSETNVTELTIESGDQKVTVKKAAPISTATTFEISPSISHTPFIPAPPQNQQLNFEVKESESSNNGWTAITSPMVGTFYKSPSPSAQAFVNVGDTISVGQTICIIEAMKLMNDLPAETAGRIMKICVENGTTVEFGQTLFMIDPNG